LLNQERSKIFPSPFGLVPGIANQVVSESDVQELLGKELRVLGRSARLVQSGFANKGIFEADPVSFHVGHPATELKEGFQKFPSPALEERQRTKRADPEVWRVVLVFAEKQRDDCYPLKPMEKSDISHGFPPLAGFADF